MEVHVRYRGGAGERGREKGGREKRREGERGREKGEKGEGEKEGGRKGKGEGEGRKGGRRKGPPLYPLPSPPHKIAEHHAINKCAEISLFYLKSVIG